MRVGGGVGHGHRTHPLASRGVCERVVEAGERWLMLFVGVGRVGAGQAHGHRDLLCGLDMDDEVELFRQWEQLHAARAHTETQDVYKVRVQCLDTRFIRVHPCWPSVLHAELHACEIDVVSGEAGPQRALGAWSKVAARARHALRRSANSPVVAALDAQALGFLQDAQPSQLQLSIPDAFQVHYLTLSVKHTPQYRSSPVFATDSADSAVDGDVRVSGC